MEIAEKFGMMDERLIRHPLGFWQVKERSSEEALKPNRAE